mgnify:CR=1 FL=1
MKKILIVLGIIILLFIGVLGFSIIYHHKTNIENLPQKQTYPTIPVEPTKSEEKTYSKNEKLWMKLLEDIMQRDEALNYEMEYLAIDFESIAKPKGEVDKDSQEKYETYYSLSEEEIETIMNDCKKYHSNVVNKSMDDLENEGLFHEEFPGGIDGICIYVRDIENVTEDSIEIMLGKYRGGLAAIWPEYKATYENGEWKIEVISMAIS